jgi:hypothetical protein
MPRCAVRWRSRPATVTVSPRNKHRPGGRDRSGWEPAADRKAHPQDRKHSRLERGVPVAGTPTVLRATATPATHQPTKGGRPGRHTPTARSQRRVRAVTWCALGWVRACRTLRDTPPGLGSGSRDQTRSPPHSGQRSSLFSGCCTPARRLRSPPNLRSLRSLLAVAAGGTSSARPLDPAASPLLGQSSAMRHSWSLKRRPSFRSGPCPHRYTSDANRGS